MSTLPESAELRLRREKDPMQTYHPDLVINAGVAVEALEAEIADLAAGYPPRAWTCPCGASHSRGHFQAVGVHRCLACGYVGPDGVMAGAPEGRP